MKRTTSAVLALAALVLSSGGCLVTSGRSVDESGVAVTNQTLGQIEAGTTTEAWLRATLGEPSDETAVAGAEGVKILRYDHTLVRREGGAIFLVFAGGSETRRTTRTWFEVKDGVVTRFWTDTAAA